MVLRELVQKSLYVVDERVAAEAILARARARASVPEIRFRSSDRRLPVRSFRRDPNARSFHLSGMALRRHVHH